MAHYGFDPQQALDAPRTFYSKDVLQVESTIAPEVRKALVDMGHAVEEAAMPFGGGQIIMIDRDNGTLAAGSEPRKDGLAIAY